MTEGELTAEIQADYLNAFRYSDHIDKKFRRLVLKARKYPVFADFFYYSPRKNRWILLFEARKKKEVGDMARITFVCYFDSPHGYYVVMPTFTNGKQHLIIYPPHFFSRYASRCGVEKSGIKLLAHFFRRNNSYVYDTERVQLSDTSYRDEIRGSTADGVAMGFLSVEGNVLFKTFVSYDMLKGEQVATFTRNEEMRKEIHEKE